MPQEKRTEPTQSVTGSPVNRRLSDGLLRLELNRPDSLNAWTPELASELRAAVQTGSADRAVRAILITGSGRAFSSGADLKARRAALAGGEPDLSSRLRTSYNPAMIAIAESEKPVIAAVNGPAVGIGASLAFNCDLIVAARSAYFLLAFVRIGLIPDGGATYRLPTLIGYARAAQMALLGERLSAERALESGLVARVFDDATFDADATEFAGGLASGPTVALGLTKRALRAGQPASFAEHLELEASLQQSLATTADVAEGTLAFREKRAPRFTGH